jgi:hypothetical protein
MGPEWKWNCFDFTGEKFESVFSGLAQGIEFRGGAFTVESRQASCPPICFALSLIFCLGEETPYFHRMAALRNLDREKKVADVDN